MYAMFYNCTNLTSVDVSNFNTSSVTNMQGMFQSCPNLTGLQISGWDVSSVTNGTVFLSGANNALSTQEYNNTLRAWSQQSVQSGVTWHFGDATYDETHPDTGYYLDFDGVDDNMVLDGTDFGSSTNATLYKTFRGDTTDTSQIMFGTNSGPWILAAQSGSASTLLSDSVGSPVYREDGTIPSYANRVGLFTALIDNTDHTIGIEEADLSASATWTSDGFYIGGEFSTTYDSTGRLYAWAAVDTRLDGRNRDLLETFMISRKTA
jgi:surface protein